MKQYTSQGPKRSDWGEKDKEICRTFPALKQQLNQEFITQE